MNKFIKFPLVLGLVGVVCAGALGLVHKVTYDIIQERLAGASLLAVREIMPEATAVEEVTADFDATKLTEAGIVTMLEVKVDDTLSAYAYQATGGGWSGQPITVQFVVSATESRFVGMKVISHNETQGGNYGAKLLDSPLFAAQFVNLDVGAVTTNVTLVAGSTANLTLSSIKGMANKVAAFHVAEVKGEEVKEVPDAAFAQLRFPEGTTFVDATTYYEGLAGANLSTIQGETGFKYFYYAKDSSDNVIGYVYYFHYIDTKDYSDHGYPYQQYMKGLFGFTTTYTNSKLYMVDIRNGTDDIHESLEEKVINQFTVDDISSWFADQNNVPNDVAAGVTITSDEINDIILGLVQYHVQLNVTIGG